MSEKPKTKWIYLRSELPLIESYGVILVTGVEAEKAAAEYGMIAPHATEDGSVVGRLPGRNGTTTWRIYRKEVPVF